MKDRRGIKHEEIAAFRRETGDRWADLPDDYVVRSFAFGWWLLGYRVRLVWVTLRKEWRRFTRRASGTYQ